MQAAGRRARKIVRLAARALAAALAALVLVALMAGLVLSRDASGPTASWARSTGHDAVWLGHAWVDGHYRPAAFRRLIARISDSGISDVYVFAGQLDSDGKLDSAGYSGARSFLAAIHAALPGVTVSAWLAGVLDDANAAAGQPASAAVPGPINLASAVTRRQIVDSAAAVPRSGFSGVHYDLEPVASGDRGYLSLIEATSLLRPRPAPLSVAVPKLEPLPGMRLPWQLSGVGPVSGGPTGPGGCDLGDAASRARRAASR